MSDGANLGIPAERALGTILGGQDQPNEEEQATPEQVRTRVMSAPSPCEHDLKFDYSLATDCIAKAFLIIAEEDPEILERSKYYSKENTDIKDLWGRPADPASAVWEAATERWPKFDEWIGGASGFMVGFAYNTVRYILDKPPAQNPAIVEIGEVHGD